jgi:DNA-binding Lrp family transcriptional regulator
VRGVLRRACPTHPQPFPNEHTADRARDVDATDFAIYRYLSPDGLVRFWASRRLVDPRVSARELAEKVGLSEAGVRSRLRTLKQRGLLRGTEVAINPWLFGVSVVMSEVPVRSPKESQALFRDLAVVDGVVFARDILDEQDRKVCVYSVADHPTATARRTALLRKFAPTGVVRGPFPNWIPPCAREPTALDWRLLTVFREHPDETLARLAAESRVSLKTTAKRFNLLLDSRACWWSHSSDSEEWPLAMLLVSLRPGVNAANVSARLAEQNESWLPVAADGLGLDPARTDRPLAGMIPVERPAALERAVRRALEVEGVTNVRRTFGLGSATYPQWVDEQLAARVGRRPEPSR